MINTPDIATIIASAPAPVQDQDYMRHVLDRLNSGATASLAAPSLPYGADYCGLTWVGGFVTVAVYKTGGAAGTTVKTLTFANDGTNYTSITAS